MRETPSKGALQPASGGGQLFSPGPGQEDPQHGRTTPYKSDRSTPSTISSPNPTTPQSQHQNRSVQRSRNSSASSTGTHRSIQTGNIFPKVVTLHTMTRNLFIGGWHVCLTTVLDHSRLISVALSIDFLVKKWVNAMAMRMIAIWRISWRCRPSGCPLVNCREKEHCTGETFLLSYRFALCIAGI